MTTPPDQPHGSSSAIYDDLAVLYATAWNRHFYTQVAEELVGDGDPTIQGRGLDLGCGAGASTLPLRRAFSAISWLGLDRSLAMLAQLRQGSDVRSVPVVRAVAESLPIASRSVRIVACSFALHWMEPTALLELQRVLVADGSLLLALPLRAPAPALPGNRLLARALLTQRHLLRERPRPGFTVGEIRSAFAAWRIHSLRVVTFTERYASSEALLQTLMARGALAALFGRQADASAVPFGTGTVNTPSPIGFGWPVALLTASAPRR